MFSQPPGTAVFSLYLTIKMTYLIINTCSRASKMLKPHLAVSWDGVPRREVGASLHANLTFYETARYGFGAFLLVPEQVR